jgi:polar amino acid transport system ATP-binding protein
MPILQVTNIHKTFGRLEVLKGISFSLEKGTALAVIGSSGSGKTTLLRCLNFLERPDTGVIRVNEKIIFDAREKEAQKEARIRKNRLNFGLVFQSFNLFAQYTVLKNITLASELMARQQGKTGAGSAVRKRIKEEAYELLSQMGLLEKADAYPHTLSGGQQQRVAIARALALKPQILCFDEPTSALDPELTGEVLRVVRKLAEKKTTMLIVTHEMAFARDVADQVIFMDDGLIVEQGVPSEVISNPREDRTRQFLSRFSSEP